MTMRTATTNFTGGQMGVYMQGRGDLQEYQNSVALLTNYRIMPQGGVRRRPGSRYCNQLPNPSPVQHEEFVFAPGQLYQMIFIQGTIDIYDGAGNFVQSIGSCPWQAYQIGFLSVFQSADYMFIAHCDTPVYTLVRSGPSAFTLSPFSFETELDGGGSKVWQPYFNFLPKQSVGMTVIYQGPSFDWTGGWHAGDPCELQCSENIFVGTHLNVIFRIGSGQFQITSVLSPTAAEATLISGDCYYTLTANPITSVANTRALYFFDPGHKFVFGQSVSFVNVVAWSSLQPDQVNQTEAAIGEVSGTTWEVNYVSDANPPPTATTVGGGPAVHVFAIQFTTFDWAEAMYSPARGYPDAVGMFGGRLILAGGSQTPNRVNLSQTYAPFNFDVGTGLDDESIQFGISQRRTPRIRRVVAGKHLQLFTDVGEFYAPFDANTGPMTPSNANFLPQTTYGIKPIVPPRLFDNATLFVSRLGYALRQFLFGNNDVGYGSPNLSHKAPELIGDPQWMSVLMEGSGQEESTAYITNSDGTMAVFSMIRSEAIAAWAGWQTNGNYVSSCNVDGAMFFLARRILNNVQTLVLEQLDAGHMLDCSVIQSAPAGSPAAPRSTWTGYTAHANTLCDIVVDGTSYQGQQTVSATGTVFIEVAAQTVEVGFAFTPSFTTLAPEIALPEGPSPGQPRRVVRALLKVDQSIDAVIDGNHFEIRKATDDLGLCPDPYTGYIEFWLMGWDQLGRITVTGGDPAPLTILAISQEIEF